MRRTSLRNSEYSYAILLERRLYGSETGLSFASFMAIGVPVALLNTLLTWLWMQFLFTDCCK